jgi:hypothetical protein
MIFITKNSIYLEFLNGGGVFMLPLLPTVPLGMG